MRRSLEGAIIAHVEAHQARWPWPCREFASLVAPSKLHLAGARNKVLRKGPKDAELRIVS
jgi:hypothetical protein